MSSTQRKQSHEAGVGCAVEWKAWITPLSSQFIFVEEWKTITFSELELCVKGIDCLHRKDAVEVNVN